MNPAEVLRGLETRVKKRFGQNFLVSEKVVSEMVDAASLTGEETVVEIGSGLGALTERLVDSAKKVIAIELDRDLAEYLRNRHLPNLTVITGNALDIDWTIDIEGDYSIVANIPYSITSPLLRKIFALQHKPKTVVLLVQHEMAERISAPAGSSERGFLTLLTEANASAKIAGKVKPGSFHPMPSVDSAILVLTPTDSKMETVFWPAIEAGFRHKRQTLANSLINDLHLSREKVEAVLEAHKLDKMVRPSVLTFDEWQAVSADIERLLR